jgi:hypothetical protein
MLNDSNVRVDPSSLAEFRFDENTLLQPRSQIVWQVVLQFVLQFVAGIRQEPMLNVSPMLFEIRIHAWKWAFHHRTSIPNYATTGPIAVTPGMILAVTVLDCKSKLAASSLAFPGAIWDK